MTADVTRVTEDYLRLIWQSRDWPDGQRRPTTGSLAAALGVTPSTVSANLKKLAGRQLIDYEPYGAIALTGEGEKIALHVVRRRRIIETFLVRQLGVEWDEVLDEADRLEHVVSERLIGRLDEILGHPAVDPHGDPIPRPGQAGEPSAVVLSSCVSGDSVQVVRVSDMNTDILRFLSGRGIGLGTTLVVEVEMSATGLMRVRHGERVAELSAPIAAAVLVVPASGAGVQQSPPDRDGPDRDNPAAEDGVTTTGR
ncbi:Iron-dependent repressor IdeR [Corynebacterium provencense]|uniref:Diphtheria toxin repressor n=1 Tax=Corynebacterium provencense TaxID=1737425 RepID=A0A2Z3YTQ3_9CORY|nr:MULTISPECIES: metal-dependent transcriptional regulator [Corynebacterium]AWT27081.1 Iron-dependent repressor IdeR [Corynebacterium provencense]MCI1255255.1 metal-dependent transcriptional regulator [Corynebacterium provencense]